MAFDKVSLTRRGIGRIAARVLLAGVGLTLGACVQDAKDRKTIDERAEQAQHSLEDAYKPVRAVSYDPLMVTSKVWSGGTALRMQRGMPLPPSFESARGVTLVSADPMSLNQIANAISSQTGIPIRLSSLTVPGQAGAASAVAAAAPTGNPGPGVTTFAPAPPTGNFSGFDPSTTTTATGATVPVAKSTEKTMPVSYEGPLSGLLEQMGAYFGVSWRYDGSTIAVSRYETRIFAIEALPGTQEINEGMQDDNSSNSSSSSSGGSSQTNTLTQNSKTAISFKYWDELKDVLTSLIGGQGSVVISPSMGTVTITTTPDVMETVSDYLNKENHRLSRQIAIDVQIYSVNIGASEDYQLQFTTFLKNLTNVNGLTYTSATVPGFANANLTQQSVLGSLNIAVVNGTGSGTVHSQDLFGALSTVGDTTDVAQFPMTTLNNRPVSRRVGKDTTYISTVNSNSTSTTTGSTIVYTPVISTVHDGFSLQLTPRLLDDGRILLQYSLSLIDVESLGQQSFNTGTATVPLTLPVTENKIFVQQSLLRSGSTLVIGGVDREQVVQNHNGVGSPDNFLLGGGISTDRQHAMLVMAITPQVINDAGAGQP
ncbi:MAG: secretin N-terminal domain-containing protein [Alphaproteobacteria bacterium]|nr:secretin N-terminal domain-containing protein [Alphaproteobacteria bacterium]